jgi:hypothetical protein
VCLFNCGLFDLLSQQIQSLVMQRDKLAVEEMQLLEELDNIENQTMHLHTQIIGKNLG